MTNDQERAAELLDRTAQNLKRFIDAHGRILNEYLRRKKELDDAEALVKTQFRGDPGQTFTSLLFEIKVSKPVEFISYDVDALAKAYPDIARQATVSMVDRDRLMKLVKQGAISSVEVSKFATSDRRAPHVTIKALTQDNGNNESV